ncbi:hypothetical protein DAPPUDRAFT_246099 [Daphnia pulex]|uniref:Uncharacterized protein n=1 Tax=Daphnia pulex TaxID=6669 RepID=E9GPM8_DAPPU|nr:hypothetical protein DAPPUDRAFT_246099 [Daphnia pulex]|eukprot:EFX78560.1 hypothetical protein DAPPUDRAFT_246099 [Daphnia pulex]
MFRADVRIVLTAAGYSPSPSVRPLCLLVSSRVPAICFQTNSVAPSAKMKITELHAVVLLGPLKDVLAAQWWWNAPITFGGGEETIQQAIQPGAPRRTQPSSLVVHLKCNGRTTRRGETQSESHEQSLYSAPSSTTDSLIAENSSSSSSQQQFFWGALGQRPRLEEKRIMSCSRLALRRGSKMSSSRDAGVGLNDLINYGCASACVSVAEETLQRERASQQTTPQTDDSIVGTPSVDQLVD